MLEAVENLALATYLRRDIFAYPVVNALHILSLGVLVTSVILMELRVLGAGRQVPLRQPLRCCVLSPSGRSPPP